MVRSVASIGAFQLRILNALSQANRGIVEASLQLSTHKRINSAADDPSGMVFVTQQRAQLTATQQALANSDRRSWWSTRPTRRWPTW